MLDEHNSQLKNKLLNKYQILPKLENVLKN